MKMLEELEYISVAETKAKLSEKLRRIEKNNRRFAITSHGKPKAVLISYKEYIALRNKTVKKTPTRTKSVSQKERKKVVDYVTSRFDEKLLSRKGQKDYKYEKVSDKK